MTEVQPLHEDFVSFQSEGAGAAGQLTLEETRARVRAGNALSLQGATVAEIKDHTITTGGHSVRVRSYIPNDDSWDRTICYVHGGGWVSGDLDYADEICRELAKSASARVVSVDYRLAPEHQFPDPVDDVCAVLEWISDAHSKKTDLAVVGDSAGANLAHVAAMRVQRAGVNVRFHALIYPALDGHADSNSYEVHKNAFPLGAAQMHFFWHSYAPEHVVDRRDPQVSPVYAIGIGEMPPLLIAVAGHDPLRDEALAFAARLQKKDHDVRLLDFPRLPHGFLRFTRVSGAAQDALACIVRQIVNLYES